MMYKTRNMTREDATVMLYSFSRQGEEKSQNLLLSYYSQQHKGERKVLIADYEGEILGYVTLLRNAKIGPYKDKFIPQIDDLNVFEPYRSSGLGEFLLNEAEKIAVKYCDTAILGISLIDDCDIAHKMFAKQDYKFMGTGIWNKDHKLSLHDNVTVDSDVKIYLIKDLDKTIK